MIDSARIVISDIAAGGDVCVVSLDDEDHTFPISVAFQSNTGLRRNRFTRTEARALRDTLEYLIKVLEP